MLNWAHQLEAGLHCIVLLAPTLYCQLAVLQQADTELCM